MNEKAKTRLHKVITEALDKGCYKIKIDQGMYNDKAIVTAAGVTATTDFDKNPIDKQLINEIAEMCNLAVGDDAPKYQYARYEGFSDSTNQNSAIYAFSVQLNTGIISYSCILEVINVICRKLSESEIADVKTKYQPGMRIMLTADMFDQYDKTMIYGCKGTINHVDDEGSIHIDWDDGSTLAILPQMDKFEIIEEEEKR